MAYRIFLEFMMKVHQPQKIPKIPLRIIIWKIQRFLCALFATPRLIIIKNYKQAKLRHHHEGS